MADKSRHSPVMLAEVLSALEPRDGGVYVDATFGAGGYSRGLLEAADCTVWGIDRDPLAQSIGAELGQEFPGRLTVLAGRFGDMYELLSSVGVERVDGVALDLGVSSMQLDDPARGFSFRADGPLDMRMDADGRLGHDMATAADVVNSMAEQELADLIYKYGEERASRRVARAIVELREKAPITRTFQALRIFVNDELGELARGLAGAEALLAPGGRLAVVSFHSLEDRAVKEFLRERSGAGPRPSRHLPDLPVSTHKPTFTLITRGTVKPGQTETRSNPRARSARLRWAVRTDAPARAAA